MWYYYHSSSICLKLGSYKLIYNFQIFKYNIMVTGYKCVFIMAMDRCLYLKYTHFYHV